MVLRLELRTAMFAALLSVLALAGGALAGEMETSQPQRTPTVELVGEVARPTRVTASVAMG